MTKRTYIPENYEPETQEAMKERLGAQFDPSHWSKIDMLSITELADTIERAVKKAKQVTEEEVRAAMAAVAEAHLNNPKPEDQQ